MYPHTKPFNKTEYYYNSLVRNLFWRSHGKITKSTRERLAKTFIDSFDFEDSKATHKSIGGYADMILDNYYHRNADAYRALKRI